MVLQDSVCAGINNGRSVYDAFCIYGVGMESQIILEKPIRIGDHEYTKLVDMSRFQTDVNDTIVELAVTLHSYELGVKTVASTGAVRRHIFIPNEAIKERTNG